MIFGVRSGWTDSVALLRYKLMFCMAGGKKAAYPHW